MSKDDLHEFRTVVKALITYKGKVLLGKKEEDENHPIGGEWHFLGGHLEKDEQMEEAVEREVEEETGLEVEVHQIIDVMTFSWDKDGEKDSLQVLYHCEAESSDAEPDEDLEEVEWVEPSELEEQLADVEAERLENRGNQRMFLEKLKQMPVI
ncbi:MAG: NUDIX domain-containing protein [Candidatus Nanohaloarchaea archaeon]